MEGGPFIRVQFCKISTKTADSAIIENKIVELFKLRQFSSIVSLLNDEENYTIIKNNALNLVSSICSEIKHEEEILSKSDYIQSCADILMVLVNKGNPKEVLLGLLEGADCINKDEFFRLLLAPIQMTLVKISDRHGATLDWVLGVLNAHFSTIPWSENKNYEGEELMLLDLDENVQRTAIILFEYINFLKLFVEKVVHEPELEVRMQQTTILQKYLLILLCRPLIYQDLHFVSGRQMSSIQSSCLKVLEYLSKICKDFCVLHKLDFCDYPEEAVDEDMNCNNVFDLAFGNLAYLMFVENLALENRPFVYASGYLFENYLQLIVSMLSRKEYLVIYKALHLCRSFLDLDFELPAINVPLSKFVKLSVALANIAVYCPVESYRCLSAILFISYIRKFTWEARYFILLSLINQVDNVGVQSLVIDLYKDFLHNVKENKIYSKYFIGKNLHQFLRQALLLKDGVKTDILENYNKIISGLNLIRYLILADSKADNFTAVYDVVGELKTSFLEPLQSGIDISKAHYQLEAKALTEGKMAKKSDLNATLTVNGEALPDLSPDCKKDIVENSLVSLDLIQSILARVLEILTQKTC